MKVLYKHESIDEKLVQVLKRIRRSPLQVLDYEGGSQNILHRCSVKGCVNVTVLNSDSDCQNYSGKCGESHMDKNFRSWKA